MSVVIRADSHLPTRQHHSTLANNVSAFSQLYDGIEWRGGATGSVSDLRTDGIAGSTPGRGAAA